MRLMKFVNAIGRNNTVLIRGEPFSFLNTFDFVRQVTEIFVDRQYYFQLPSKDSQRILDLGSNVGVSAIYFLTEFPQARIECFEPSFTTFSVLRDNLKHYSRVSLHRLAVGDESSPRQLFSSRNKPAAASFWDRDFNDTSVVETVNQLSLADILQDSRVDLLKMDIEGAEYESIASLSDEQLLLIDRMVVELHFGGNLKLTDALSLAERLLTLNYRVLIFSPNGSEVEALFAPDGNRHPSLLLKAIRSEVVSIDK